MRSLTRIAVRPLRVNGINAKRLAGNVVLVIFEGTNIAVVMLDSVYPSRCCPSLGCVVCQFYLLEGLASPSSHR